MTLRTALGRTIRRLRTERGMSQTQFGGRCRIARTYYGGIERGAHNVSLDYIERIAKALNLDTAQLFKLAERERKPRPAKRP